MDGDVEPYLQIRNITKVYAESSVQANDNVSLDVTRGEIHALAGENGAGKSTLMKILYGLERADSGSIHLDGEEVRIHNPVDATRLGIGMVHQHFKLVGDFTVAQNVVLGAEPRKGLIFLDAAAAERRVDAVISRNGFNISAGDRIAGLSVGQMQQVEIVKMLYRDADLLILDEPTSVLTEQEIRGLFETLQSLRAQGKTIILITHKLDEVKRISDRITVMRNGRIVDTRTTARVDEADISRMMVGKSVAFDFSRQEGGCTEPVFVMKDVTLTRKHQERPLLTDVSLSVSTCEIVGITGVTGNGLSELEDVIAGLTPATGGSIHLNDRHVTGRTTTELRDLGMAYVPTDRLRRGASLGTSVKENMIVANHHEYMNRAGVFDGEKIDAYARQLISEYLIDGDGNTPVGNLSGGNIQKVILARELDRVKDFILFSEPTWGLDVASSEFIYEKILEARARGVAVMIISSDIDEVLSLADTVMVMYRGRIVTKRSASPELDRELIGEYMMGLRDDLATKGSDA